MTATPRILDFSNVDDQFSANIQDSFAFIARHHYRVQRAKQSMPVKVDECPACCQAWPSSCVQKGGAHDHRG